MGLALPGWRPSETDPAARRPSAWESFIGDFPQSASVRCVFAALAAGPGKNRLTCADSGRCQTSGPLPPSGPLVAWPRFTAAVQGPRGDVSRSGFLSSAPESRAAQGHGHLRPGPPGGKHVVRSPCTPYRCFRVHVPACLSRSVHPARHLVTAQSAPVVAFLCRGRQQPCSEMCSRTCTCQSRLWDNEQNRGKLAWLGRQHVSPIVTVTAWRTGCLVHPSVSRGERDAQVVEPCPRRPRTECRRHTLLPQLDEPRLRPRRTVDGTPRSSHASPRDR